MTSIINLRPKQLAGLALVLSFAAIAPLSAQVQPQSSSDTTQQPPLGYANSIHVPDPRKPVPAKLGAYTLAQVIDMARTKNLTLLAAQRNLQAVRAQEIQAGVRQNPNLGVAGTDVTEPDSANNPYNYSVQISRLFERGNKREWRLDSARATTAQTEAQLQDTTRQTILSVKTAFTQMLMAKASLQLATDSLSEFQHEVDISHDRYQAGDLSKIDFERLDLQLASFESDEATGLVNLRQASDQLQTLIGIDIPTADFDITGEVVPPVVTQTQAELTQDALDKRPDFAAAKFAISVAEANQKLAYANGTTDPTLEAEYDRAGTENTAGFSVNIPLRIFDHNQGNKKTAVFQTEASKFTAAAAHNQVISDVDQAWVNYAQSKRLSDRYTQHYLDETTDVLSIAQFAFEHGGIALIDYLDAVRDTRTTDAAAISAYQQTWLAIHQLSAASATELVP
ncbi:TolC family protein [Granulicella sp. 5B5]|uniref:TolC family protein n=1 Tax=Granulicella sp. 5B5 TaxID=1617967 RepID=UPI0015F5EBE4|nr:TolC family protein [Granulicella sp. 5B5]QMV19476.1 TolC family protein [Granulicella sp. 5B5]